MSAPAKPLPADPVLDGGIAGFGQRLRTGATTATAVTEAYLARIEALDDHLGSYEHVAAERALATAQAIDALLAAGVDLGPLMGVPVGIKDLIEVEGMPTTAGSYVDVADMIGPEGRFIRRMKRAGCVILGKTKTIEFAFGAGHHTRGTPWNPWDATTKRWAGGSSTGSAVAVAAGMCGFAIGSDTGGSVRLPAAFCGTVGLKTTAGRWPTEGVFPLSTTFDTLGPLTRTVEDAAIAFAVLDGDTPSDDVPAALPSRGLRLGKPDTAFFDDLDPDVTAAVSAALERLAAAGVDIAPVRLPEVVDSPLMAIVPPTELIAGLGRERFLKERDRMDRDMAARAAMGLEVTADVYIGRIRRHRELCHIAVERMAGFDAWITPTCPLIPSPIAAFESSDDEQKFHTRMPQCTRPGNAFGMCAVTLPLRGPETGLPVGLQVMGLGGTERQVLAVARALEAELGTLSPPDVSDFQAGATGP